MSARWMDDTPIGDSVERDLPLLLLPPVEPRRRWRRIVRSWLFGTDPLTQERAA